MNVRYQVLWDAEPPKTGSEKRDFYHGQKVKAQRFAGRQRKAGKKNVSVWDCYDNPISNMFKI